MTQYVCQTPHVQDLFHNFKLSIEMSIWKDFQKEIQLLIFSQDG